MGTTYHNIVISGVWGSRFRFEGKCEHVPTYYNIVISRQFGHMGYGVFLLEAFFYLSQYCNKWTI